MSKTFTSRPSNLSQRGRGRGRTQTSSEEPGVVGTNIAPWQTAAAARGQTRGRRTEENGRTKGGGSVSRGCGVASRGHRTDPGGKIHASSRSTLQERTSYAGGFTVIRPDEKRRREISEQAEREAKQYEQFKKQNKPASFSYVGTAGGGESMSLIEARQQQMRNQAQHSKASRLVREQDRRSQQRQEENKALVDRKNAARKQMSLNMQKQKEKPETWKSEMNRVNQAFLDRLEAQSKDKVPSAEET